MRLIDSYTVVVTEATEACRDYYATWFGFEVAFEASWFVLMTHPGEHPLSLAFMRPDHPSVPPSPRAHQGDGSFLTLQVDDATAEYARLLKAGPPLATDLTDEPWGQRRLASMTRPACGSTSSSRSNRWQDGGIRMSSPAHRSAPEGMATARRAVASDHVGLLIGLIHEWAVVDGVLPVRLAGHQHEPRPGHGARHAQSASRTEHRDL